VRLATDDDLEEAGRICVDAYQSAGQLDDGPHQGYGVVLADVASRQQDAVLLVAERDGSVVGTVTICPQGSSVAEIGRDGEVEFRFLAVDPPAWRSGVADALIDACDQYARSTGAHSLAISVRDINHGARALYEKRGFTRAADRDWSPVPTVQLYVLTRAVQPE
jgi:GNAT superfamily N-acetyltransferase